MWTFLKRNAQKVIYLFHTSVVKVLKHTYINFRHDIVLKIFSMYTSTKGRGMYGLRGFG